MEGTNIGTLFDHREPLNRMPVLNSINRSFSYEKLPYDELVQSLQEVALMTDEGYCSDGENKIYSYRFGNPDEKVIFLHGSIHGAHEWRCAYWLREFTRQLLYPSNDDKLVADALKSKYYFIIIPCANPYGYIHHVRQNANGVDLERNFPIFWEGYEPSSSSQNKGPSPASEVETQIITSILNSGNVALHIDLHVEGAPETSKADTLTVSTGRTYSSTAFLTRVGVWTLREIEKREGVKFPYWYQQLWDAPISPAYADSLGIISAIVEGGGAQTKEDNAEMILEYLWRLCWALAVSTPNSRLGRSSVYGLV